MIFHPGIWFELIYNNKNQVWFIALAYISNDTLLYVRPRTLHPNEGRQNRKSALTLTQTNAHSRHSGSWFPDETRVARRAKAVDAGAWKASPVCAAPAANAANRAAEAVAAAASVCRMIGLRWESFLSVRVDAEVISRCIRACLSECVRSTVRSSVGNAPIFEKWDFRAYL